MKQLAIPNAGISGCSTVWGQPLHGHSTDSTDTVCVQTNAKPCRVWFITLASLANVATVMGYTTLQEHVLCIAWLKQAKAPLLLVSLAPGTLLGLSPDLTPTVQGKPAGRTMTGFKTRREKETLCFLALISEKPK